MSNKCCIIGKSIYFGHDFGEQFVSNLNILINILHITIRGCSNFNQQIILTRGILSLNIDARYKKLLKLPAKFRSLSILEYSQKLELNKCMKYLRILSGYSHKIILNKSMYYASLGYNWDDYIVPNKMLVKLYVDNVRNEYMELPKHLTHLSIIVDFNISVRLPPSIVELTFGYHSTKDLILKPSTKQIRVFIYSHNYCLLDNLPNNKNPIILETSKLQLEKANNLPSNLIIEIQN